MKRRFYGFLFLFAFWGVACEGFDDQLILNKAGRLHDSGKFNEAIRLYNLVINKDPDNKTLPDKALARYELGMAYLDVGKQAKAVEQVEVLRKWKRNDLATSLYAETQKNRDKYR